MQSLYSIETEIEESRQMVFPPEVGDWGMSIAERVTKSYLRDQFDLMRKYRSDHQRPDIVHFMDKLVPIGRAQEVSDHLVGLKKSIEPQRHAPGFMSPKRMPNFSDITADFTLKYWGPVKLPKGKNYFRPHLDLAADCIPGLEEIWAFNLQDELCF